MSYNYLQGEATIEILTKYFFNLCFYSNAPWANTDEYVENNQNFFKKTGRSLAKGNFYGKSPRSLIVGAPNAFNFLGAVFICDKCFTRFVMEEAFIF